MRKWQKEGGRVIIGVLALQGAFREHIEMLKEIGVTARELRNNEDLHGISGVIIPGGESTAIGKLLRDLHMFEPLKEMILKGIPVYGTCAGMIILAKNLVNDDRVHIATMDIEVKRNAYGRQSGSFKTLAKIKGIEGMVDMVFVRAPYIEKVGKNVEILAMVDGDIVAARQENLLVTSFHPELTKDTKLHQYFYKMCEDNNLEPTITNTNS